MDCHAKQKSLFVPHLTEVKELEDVSMPGLKVHGERALPLASALIHVTRCNNNTIDSVSQDSYQLGPCLHAACVGVTCIIEHSQHGHNPIGCAVRPSDVAFTSPHIMDRHTDTCTQANQ